MTIPVCVSRPTTSVRSIVSATLTVPTGFLAVAAGLALATPSTVPVSWPSGSAILTFATSVVQVRVGIKISSEVTDLGQCYVDFIVVFR